MPLLVRWPGKIEAGSISNEIVQHHDWLPTFLAMAGAPDVVDKLKKGYKAIGRTYKNHIDGVNLLPYLTGKEKKSPRNFFFYFSDDGDVLGYPLRQLEAGLHGAAPAGHDRGLGRAVRALRLPKIFNLRTDPYEFADITSNTYYDWMLHTLTHLRRAGGRRKFAETFKEFPPRRSRSASPSTTRWRR